VHVSTMADDYYRFEERAHILRGENTGRVYRLGDKVSVQVIKVDMERRQVDLGLTEILDRVRESERNRGPRTSRAGNVRSGRDALAPSRGRAKSGQGKKSEQRRAQRPGRKERAARRKP
jgi:ribonuclease R